MINYFAIFMVCLVFGSCTSYYYAGRKFNNRADAEAAKQEDLKAVYDGIAPRLVPLADRAHFVIPTKAVVEQRGVRGGNAEGRDYVASSLYSDYKNTGKALEKRNTFKKLDFEESNEPDHIPGKKGEIYIYLYMQYGKSGGWYYRNGERPPRPLFIEHANPDLAGRLKFFIEMIESYLAEDETNRKPRPEK